MNTVYNNRAGSTTIQRIALQDPGHDTSVMAVIKVGTIAPRARIEPTSLVLYSRPAPLHHLSSLMSPLYPMLIC